MTAELLDKAFTNSKFAELLTNEAMFDFMREEAFLKEQDFDLPLQYVNFRD